MADITHAVQATMSTPLTGGIRFSFRKQNYIFNFKGSFLWIVLPLIILCCFLGMWQLHRYHFKVQLLQQYHAYLATPPKTLTQLMNGESDWQFQHVQVTGVYRNDLSIVLQNKFYQGHPGFEVLTPLQVSGDNKLILVDRGWLPAPGQGLLPQLDKIVGTQRLSGHIKVLNEYQFILGKNVISATTLPRVLQKIDWHELSQVTGQVYYPFILRLDENQAHGFVRDWPMVTILPERHMAYAIQWFAFALILCVGFIFFCIQRIDENEARHETTQK